MMRIPYLYHIWGNDLPPEVREEMGKEVTENQKVLLVFKFIWRKIKFNFYTYFDSQLINRSKNILSV